MKNDRNWAEIGLVLVAILAVALVSGYYAFIRGAERAVPKRCADFHSQDSVKLYIADIGADRFRFDGDRDGTPCESLPSH